MAYILMVYVIKMYVVMDGCSEGALCVYAPVQEAYRLKGETREAFAPTFARTTLQHRCERHGRRRIHLRAPYQSWPYQSRHISNGHFRVPYQLWPY